MTLDEVDSSAADLHRWRAVVVLGLFAVAAGMLVPLVVPALHGRSVWWTSTDAWLSLRAAHYVPQGTYPLIYEAGTVPVVFDSGPLLPLVLAPVAAIGDLFHFRESYPLPQAHPTMWLVYGPYALASVFPLLYGVRALATQLGMRGRRLFLQWAAVFLAFVPMAIVYGHYEDVIALALVLLALRDLFAGRELRGACLLAVAIGFKQWSVLAVPLYVVACPVPLRLRAAIRSLVPPAVLFSVFLVADYRYASRALLHPPTFASLGHAAPWIASSTDYIASEPTRVGAFVLAVGAAWCLGKRRDPTTIMSALGTVFLCRVLFEPVVHAYYLAPGLVLLLFVPSTRTRFVTNASLSGLLLVLFAWHPARWIWWMAVYALIGVLLYEPVRRWKRDDSYGPISVSAPIHSSLRERVSMTGLRHSRGNS